MLTFRGKSLYRFTCAKNACEIKEFWQHSLQLAELYYILLVYYTELKAVFYTTVFTYICCF